MLNISDLKERYRNGTTTPATVIQEIFQKIRDEGERPVWISLADAEATLARAQAVDVTLPLGGVPFAVKDNFDVDGMFTTAGCPSFAYLPSRTSTVVRRLLDAGAILIGKTNMDQFATGLVGQRSPYGACSSVFNARYISGGSSSGSAVAVAKSLCAFALGTDTAGSGRVPAAFNNLVGFKPTRGLWSCSGVVPACKSLDCVSVFAATAADANAVRRVTQAFDRDDPFSRSCAPGSGAAPWLTGSFRFGVPDAADLNFFDDGETPVLYERAIERLQQIGGIRTTIDFSAFREAAQLLYSGPWVAERYAAVGDFLQSRTDGVNDVVRQVILGGLKYSAADAYRAMYELEQLKRRAADEWARMDILLLPTTGTIYTRDAVAANPIHLNSNLGYYTNFVNLMDLAAVAVPAGLRSDGLPFGVSLIGPAFSDEALLGLASSYLGEAAISSAPGCIPVAVVGAHLSGQPLNHQLTERGARLLKSCRTAGDYRLFALNNTSPPKPGLVWEEGFPGWGIEVEVWAVPENLFGGFVASVPPPLAIGNVLLEDGAWVKGFVCEPHAVSHAREITRFGGWNNYLTAGAGAV
jgi:allophanate hydrolase